MEWKIWIESVNKDNSHSWVRISHGLNKLVTDLIDKEYDDKEQVTSETKTEAFALKTDVFVFASRSKAKAKPRRPTSACSSTRTVPIGERYWTDIELGNIRLSPTQRQKDWTLFFGMDIYLEKKNGRLNSGDQKIIFGTKLRTLSIGLVKCGRARWRKQQGKISILYWPVRRRSSLLPSPSRSFRTQSHWSYTSGQCVDFGQLLRGHLSYWMCSQCTLHHKFRIDSGRTNSSKEIRTVFFTAVNPVDKDHKDPHELDLTKPRLASYKQKKWKRHQDTVYWVDIQLAQRKRLKFCQTRSKNHHPQWYTPSFLYLESDCDEIWRN